MFPSPAAAMSFRPDLQTTLDRFARAWNTDDGDERWQLVHAAAAPEVSYTDPHSEKPVQGQAALTAFMALFREQVGWHFAFSGAADGHHEWVRVPWRLTDSAGSVMATGLLVGALDRAVRFTRIVDFVDPE